MALVTKKNVKVGLKIFSCWDDRPLDGFGYSNSIITEVFDDHYLYTDLDLNIKDIWGEYDTNPETDSVAVFTTENEAKKWLKI